MGTTFGEGLTYAVCARKDDHGEFGFGSFEGQRATSEASDHFDKLKQHPDAREVWMTRLDGGEWVFVERIRKDDRGQWKKVAPSTPFAG